MKKNLKKKSVSSTARFHFSARDCRSYLLALACVAAIALSFQLSWRRWQVSAAPQGQIPVRQQREIQNERRLAALIRQMTDRSSEGLTETVLPSGGVAVDLDGHFQQVSLVKNTPDGGVLAGCVESLAEANAFFGHDLETGRSIEGAA
ncbi:MAG TPA: hypothetical protein PLQ88_16980, partial [Blastocatellia bacterium]|nr:hypothetical protein [Blastocatellia bacterium]